MSKLTHSKVVYCKCGVFISSSFMPYYWPHIGWLIQNFFWWNLEPLCGYNPLKNGFKLGLGMVFDTLPF